MKTPGLTGAVLGVAAVFGISWIAAIAYWRLGTRVPGPGEIAGLMLGMPASLAGALAWWRRREPAVQSDATRHDATAGASRIAPTHPRFSIRAAALELPIGNDFADVLARSADGTGLALHPRLRDPRGCGLLAAEVPGLDTGRLDVELAALVATTRARPELVRALALADPVLEQLLAVESAPVACGLLLPGDWSAVEHDLARRWLERRVDAAGAVHPVRVSTFAVASGHELFRLLRSALPVDDEALAGPRLWLAVSSRIGAGSVDRWARRGMLLGADTPQGLAPGEAAAGLLLEAWSEGSDGAVVHLPDPAPAARDDHHGAGLSTLLGAALSTTGIVADDIGLVVSDVDHRAKHGAQLAAGTSEHLPRLDPAAGVIRLGLACGHADAVLALAAVALGAHAANASGQTSLAVGIHNIDGPAVALVAPPPPSP